MDYNVGDKVRILCDRVPLRNGKFSNHPIPKGTRGIITVLNGGSNGYDFRVSYYNEDKKEMEKFWFCLEHVLMDKGGAIHEPDFSLEEVAIAEEMING